MPWNELSELETAQAILWEVYKEYYGVRPRNVYSEFQWNDLKFVEDEIDFITRMMESDNE